MCLRPYLHVFVLIMYFNKTTGQEQPPNFIVPDTGQEQNHNDTGEDINPDFIDHDTMGSATYAHDTLGNATYTNIQELHNWLFAEPMSNSIYIYDKDTRPRINQDARSLPYDISDECLLLAVVAFYWDAWYPVRVNINGLDLRDPVEVTISFVPNSILDVDMTEQKFSVLGYFVITWTDELLVWETFDFLTSMTKLPLEKIWRPGIVISKSLDVNKGVAGTGDLVLLRSTGQVTWVPEGKYTAVCEVDINYFPFDQQECTLTYYVSDETANFVVLGDKNDSDKVILLDDFTENSMWTVNKVYQRRYLLYGAYYIDVVFEMARRSYFLIFTLIMPLMMLAFLNICLFLIPIESGEKGSFSITIFLSYGIFLTVVADTLPPNSMSVSYLILFMLVLLLLSVVSVLYTIVQARIYADFGDKPVTLHVCNSLLCLFRSPQVGTIQKDPSNEDDETERDNTQQSNDDGKALNTYTWGMLLKIVDKIMFLFFLIGFIITAITFMCILNGG